MAGISPATCATEKLYTSLESPDMQLFETLSTMGMALRTNPSRPFEWNSIVFIQVVLAALLEGPDPFSIEILNAGY